jgi:type II secretory pathway pseudopilin PulG
MKKKSSGGFTFIGLIMSIGIIALLAAIAIPTYSSYKEDAMIARANEELKKIEVAIVTLATDTARWPGAIPIGVVANVEFWNLNAPSAGIVATDGNFPSWAGPYFPSVPQDPWGNNYFFDPDHEIGGTDFAVLDSFGPNGVGPNVYDSDDVYIVQPLK